MVDKIILKDMQFYGFHGLFPEENKLGQRFNVDLILYTNLKQAGMSDEMSDSINYGEVFTNVQKIVEGKKQNLIETVAERIAEDLLQNFARLQACDVKVIKPDPPIPGHYNSVAVQIYRGRDK